MHGLEAPLLVHELDRQPVEQRRVARGAAVLAELEHRRHDRLAEVAHPEVVHRHPRGQGVRGVGNPAREREAPAAALDGIGRQLAAGELRAWRELGVGLRLGERFFGLGQRLLRLLVRAGLRDRALGDQEGLLGVEQRQAPLGRLRRRRRLAEGFRSLVAGVLQGFRLDDGLEGLVLRLRDRHAHQGQGKFLEGRL